MILKFLCLKLNHAILVLLVCAAAGTAPACLDLSAPEPGNTGDARKWLRTSGNESSGYYVRRRPGLDHMFFYLPTTADGTRELDDVVSQLQAGGYNVMTYRGNANAEPPAPADAFDAAAARLGYRKRLLVVDGRRLLPALQVFLERRGTFDAMMVLRPGDAWGDRRELRTLRDELPTGTPFYWIPTGRGIETVRANTLRSMLFRRTAEQEGATVIEHMLSELARRRDEDFRLELSETLLYELVRLRREPEWQEAAGVFQGGCGYRPGARGRRSLNGFTSSGSRDRDFCPAYLRRDERRVYRNTEILDDGCVYRRMDRRERLYCHYEQS